MVDVFVNGVKFVNGVDYTATNGTTVVLTDALTVGQIVEIDNYLTAFLPTNALRTITTFTATAGQTTFSVTYTQGLIDVYYNGSCLAQSEYTAINGTSIILATACQVNDIVVVYAYSYSVGAYSGIGGSGTTNYVSKFTSSNVIGNSLIYDNGTYVSIGTTSANAKFQVAADGAYVSNWDAAQLWVTGTDTAKRLQIGYDTTNGYGIIQAIHGGVSVKNLLLNPQGGNVGIGTSSPSYRLDTYTSNQYIGRFDTSDSTGGFITFAKSNTATGYMGSAYHIVAGTQSSSDLAISAVSNLVFGSGSSLTERMRISSSGNIVIGRSDPGTTRLMVCGVDTSSSNYTLFAQDSTTNNLFYVRNDGLIVTGNRTNSPYNLAVAGRDVFVASDGGLGYNSSVRESKINIQNIDSVEWLLNLNPVSFNKRKKDEDGKYIEEYYEDLDYGLIAEEAELVNDKICFYDETEEGKIIRGVSYSKLTTPMLKLIQQQQAKIEELSAKVSALENKS